MTDKRLNLEVKNLLRGAKVDNNYIWRVLEDSNTDNTYYFCICVFESLINSTKKTQNKYDT